MFDEIGLLVLEGDAAGLAAKVSELIAARRDPAADALANGGDGRRRVRERRERVRSGGSNGGPRDAPAPLVHSPHS